MKIYLKNHRENCIIINEELAVPFVIYADFEAITEKILGCKLNNKQSYTEACQKRTCC